MPEVQAIPDDDEPTTLRATTLPEVVDARDVPMNPPPKRADGIDWTFVLKGVVDAVMQNPALMEKLFGIKATPGDHAAMNQAAAQIAAGHDTRQTQVDEPEAPRARMDAYRSMLRHVPASMVKAKAIEHARGLATLAEGTSADTLKERVMLLLETAHDDDLAVVEGVLAILKGESTLQTEAPQNGAA